MSAICGIIQQDCAPIAAARCRMVSAALEPYGCDAEGSWDGGHVAFGSRLKRLLPEDANDRQPVIGSGGSSILIADIRLDNRADLGRALDLPCERLQEMADADLLSAAYEKWGHGVIDHLVGDFAFAIWDCSQRRLFLARDQMGRRPLFYHQGRGWFGFASMPAGLLALPGVARGADEQRIRDLLFLLPDVSRHSYFSGIDRLLPGHAALLEADGAFRSWCYWTPATTERIHFKSDDDYVDAFLETLEEAVRCRLRSAGGIASQLSAGFDSATVASVAAHLLRAQGGLLDAFTAVPNPDGLPPASRVVMDEGPLAAQVAAIFPNIRHHRTRTDDAGLVEALAAMFRLFNRPAKNLVNLVWDMAISKQAAALGCSTLLVGELGNFTISYAGDQVLNSLLRECRFADLARQSYRRWRGGRERRLAIIAQTVMPSLPYRLRSGLEALLRPGHDSNRVVRRLTAAFRADPAFRRYCRDLQIPEIMSQWDESRSWRAKRLIRHDFAEYGKGTLALGGIDRRDPTVDIRLIRYCLAIPVEQYNKDGVDRWLLRRALARYWPTEIIASRVKGRQGADTPWRIVHERRGLETEIQLLKALPEAVRYLDLAAIEMIISGLSSSTSQEQGGEHERLLRLIAAGHFTRMAAPANCLSF